MPFLPAKPYKPNPTGAATPAYSAKLTKTKSGAVSLTIRVRRDVCLGVFGFEMPEPEKGQSRPVREIEVKIGRGAHEGLIAIDPNGTGVPLKTGLKGGGYFQIIAPDYLPQINSTTHTCDLKSKDGLACIELPSAGRWREDTK